MNIEHYFYNRTGHYQPFEGICFVDTFDLAQTLQLDFLRENTRRVEKQKQTPMFVIVGNPPYNVGQVNENDNNKNRKYPIMDKQVRQTYTKDSTATNKKALSDPYVKAIRWASDRIETEGVVAFITNNSFIGDVAFDGMRKHLAADFDTIYILDLGGNARKGLKVSDANVFGITVGVSINFFIKRRDNPNPQAKIFYARVDESWHKKATFEHLISWQHYRNDKIKWREIMPDNRHTWLTEGLRPEFETFIPMGSKQARIERGEAVDVIFKTYSRGVVTCRDSWAYNFNRNALTENMGRMIDTYNAEFHRWQRRENRGAEVDEFVDYDEAKIKWSEGLKSDLRRGRIAEYAEGKVRNSLYRPFTKSNLYFDRMMIERVYGFPSIFPTPETETKNRVICVAGIGDRKGFGCLMTNRIPSLDLAFEKNQCFPFYTYDENGRNRRENITDWALAQFRAHYRADRITKWDIFHYVYALLHHPDYRERYEANLKRDLPHLPYAPNFLEFAKAGQELGKIHVGYEDVEEYTLRFVEKPNTPIFPVWRR